MRTAIQSEPIQCMCGRMMMYVEPAELRRAVAQGVECGPNCRAAFTRRGVSANMVESRPPKRRRSAPMPYAWICLRCEHQLSRHGLVSGSPITGPYRCPCGCEVAQGEPAGQVTEQQFRDGVGYRPLPG